MPPVDLCFLAVCEANASGIFGLGDPRCSYAFGIPGEPDNRQNDPPLPGDPIQEPPPKCGYYTIYVCPDGKKIDQPSEEDPPLTKICY